LILQKDSHFKIHLPFLSFLIGSVALFSAFWVEWSHSSGRPDETIRFRPVSQEVVEVRLQKFAGKDKDREEAIKQLFADAGCKDELLTEQVVKHSKLPNVICSLPGATNRTIIVGAHFDHVDAGDGVVDNWSGVSLLPSLYEAIKVVPRNHSYLFVAFTDEEKGEIGSHFFAQQMSKDQVSSSDAMVNMDTLGLAPTKVWVSHSDKKLASLLLNLAQQLAIPLGGVDVDLVGSTDSVQFSARKIPAITIHSLTQATYNARILHTSKDKLSAIHLDEYYQTYHLIAAYLAYLDQTLPAEANTNTH